MDILVGTKLTEIIDLLDSSNIQDDYKKLVLNFCKSEISNGDKIITNELELAMIKAWFNNTNQISMPDIHNKYKLKDIYYDKNGNTIYEEYESDNNSFYLRTIFKDEDGKILKVYLSHKTDSFANIVKNGGVEDTFLDKNNNGIADSRTTIKTIINPDKSRITKFKQDINLDGEFD